MERALDWRVTVNVYRSYTMDIRVATPADAHILADLNANFNGVQMTPERMADQILRCYDVECALIARIDGTAEEDEVLLILHLV